MCNRLLRYLIVSLGLVILFVAGPLEPPASAGPSAPGIKRASSAIAVTADGRTLLVVNPDSNSLSLVNLVDSGEVTELPVGIDPRSVAVDDAGQRAYVANRGSAGVSVVDLAARAVTAHITTGYQPYGVVVSPDGDRLYITEQGAGRVRIVGTHNLATEALLPVRERPSGLAISNDGHTLYVTHLLGNTITVIELGARPTYLPLLLHFATGDSSSSISRPSAGSHRLSVAALLRRFADSPPTVGDQSPATSYRQSEIALWPTSNLVQSIAIAPDEQWAWIPHTRANSANRALTFETTVFPVITPVDLGGRRMVPASNIALDTTDQPVGLPFDAAFSPDGSRLWVVNAASNDVSVVDLRTRTLAAHIPVSDNPRGIVLSPDGDHAYVNNTLAGTVSVIDTAVYTVTARITVTQIPLPPVLLRGKRLFNSSADPRMSKLAWISCNTCHFDGEQDGQTWTFAFAGPRNTTSLLGMIETYPLRWSGEWDESADSEFAVRRENFGAGLLDGDMNCAASPPDCVHQPPNQGRSYDLDALAAFLDSLQAAPSPYPMSAAARRGQAVFERSDTRCAECHPAPLYTDRKIHDVGTVTTGERIGPAYDTPTLRGLWNSAPYLHDGSAPALIDVLTVRNSSNMHGVTLQLSAQELADLAAFMLALPQ